MPENHKNEYKFPIAQGDTFKFPFLSITKTHNILSQFTKTQNWKNSKTFENLLASFFFKFLLDV